VPGFWLVALGMTAAALGFVLARLLFPEGAARWADPREASLAALRASWAELERDRDAGLLPADQHEAARDELSRRALEELGERVVPAARRPARIAALMAAIALPVAAFALYGAVGHPGAVENAGAFERFAGTLTAEQAPAFRDQLARHLADNPDDARAWALLGRIELALDRFAESGAAFERAVADRKVARDPDIWCDYADAAGLAQGGRLAGRPADFIARALALDASHPRALEMAGSLAIEQGDPAQALRQWRLLLDQLAANDPRRPGLARAVSRLERLAAPDMTKS
jgi:cytochrome c-type biogenesis protein CcmH